MNSKLVQDDPSDKTCLKLHVERVNAYGVGVAHSNGEKYFIPFALTGEEVEARLRGVVKNARHCDLVRVITASPARVRPPCSYYGDCGGCDLQHVEYAEELRLKESWVRELFAGFGGARINGIIASPQEYAYRNRVTLHGDGTHLGFHERGSNVIVDVESCAVASAAVNLKIRGIRNSSQIPQGELPVREDDSVSFTQINTEQNANLIATVLVAARTKKSARVLELYSGQGNLSFPLANICKEVVAIEGDAAAVHDAEAARVFGKIRNVKFIRDDVYQAAFRLAEDYQCFSVIVCDPPREGLRHVAKILPQLHPEKIVYVSCEPHALARDAAFLESKGYRLTALTPLDMFPKTHHVEVVGTFVLD